MVARLRGFDDCIYDLDAIVAEAVRAGSYRAVFPAMYRTVTCEVRRAAGDGFFEDPARLEMLVVTFADLYVEAAAAFRAGNGAPACWEIAFRVADSRRRRSVLQHLLLGMNAHINFDLGLATARLGAARGLPPLYGDFIKVNEILFTLIDDLQAALNSVSPWMGLVDRAGLGIDEGFMRLGLRTCRDRAWQFAELVSAAADDHERETAIGQRDGDVHRLGQFISSRLSPFHLVNTIVRLRESRDLAAIVDAFRQHGVDLDVVARRAAGDLERPPPAPDASLRRPRRRPVVRVARRRRDGRSPRDADVAGETAE